jgi:CheY-like chemotaxis protein
MGDKRVLFVDDEIEEPSSEESELEGEALRGYMQYYVDRLEREHYTVITATGPDEAIVELQKDTTYDLVILDLMMPHGESFGGEETSRGLRTGAVLAERLHRELPNVPIVILSNLVPSTLTDAPHDCQSLVDQGIVRGLFLKPNWRPSMLVERLIEILSSNSESLGRKQ